MDESAKIKNPVATLTQTFFELFLLFRKRVIMTGTPVANRPYDIWAQIYFLDQGKSLGTDFHTFKKQTNLSNRLADGADLQEAFEKAVSEIYRKIAPFSVRETKNSGIVALPDKVYIREDAYFTPEQKRMYDRICHELRIEIRKDGCMIEDESEATVKRLLRLVQVASNPRLLDESYQGTSAKERVLDEVIQKILSDGEKCIVWTNFIENAESFSKKYCAYGCAKIHGRMSIKERNRSIERFGTEECNILFATPASAKEGLTLTMANHVVFYGRGFSLDDYLQAQDRIHRISQRKTCYIHNIILHESIDEWVDVLLKSKQNAARLTQGDIDLTAYKEVADYRFGEMIKEILSVGQEENANE